MRGADYEELLRAENDKLGSDQKVYVETDEEAPYQHMRTCNSGYEIPVVLQSPSVSTFSWADIRRALI